VKEELKNSKSKETHKVFWREIVEEVVVLERNEGFWRVDKYGVGFRSREVEVDDVGFAAEKKKAFDFGGNRKEIVLEY
jgi:hypothetical protein